MFSMNTVGVVVALLMTNGADAFFASPSKSHHQHCSQLFSFRQSYQHDLEQLSRMGHIEELNGKLVDTNAASEKMAEDLQASQDKTQEAEAKLVSLQHQHDLEQLSRMGHIEELNGKLVDTNAAFQKMAEDLQASQDEAQEAETKLVSLQLEMEGKIAEQAQTIQSLDIALQQQTTEAQKNWMTIEKVKSEADTEKTAVIAEFKAREEALQREMHFLTARLAKEEHTVKVQHEASNNILANRIELDRELSLLKKQHTTDIKEWESKLRAEEELNNRILIQSQQELNQVWLQKIGNEMSVRDKEAETTSTETEKMKNEIVKMKTEMAKMESERNSARSLFKRSIKILFRRRRRQVHEDTA